MGQARNWTQEEKEYLSENWGHLTVPYMAKKLERTNLAVKQMASRLGLGRYFDNGEYITLNQLINAVAGHNVYTYMLTSWVENRGLPVHNKRLDEKVVRVVYLEEFWEWAEANRSFIDFSKMEPLALGEEPRWLQEQRKKDFKAFAIQRRCTDLGIKERPVKADNHGPASVWTEDMYAIIADGIRYGDSYMVIADALGKSEKAVRGKVYNMYFTEDADKVRAMLKNGEWGSGRPEVRVKQAAHLSEFRTETRKQLSIIVGLLRYRMNELGYEPYWQRHMCMKWDDLYGCKAGCENCDECTKFERIPEQYCARCGCTFFERIKNRFCNKCRVARKKKAQKHWVMMKKG